VAIETTTRAESAASVTGTQSPPMLMNIRDVSKQYNSSVLHNGRRPVWQRNAGDKETGNTGFHAFVE